MRKRLPLLIGAIAVSAFVGVAGQVNKEKAYVG